MVSLSFSEGLSLGNKLFGHFIFKEYYWANIPGGDRLNCILWVSFEMSLRGHFSGFLPFILQFDYCWGGKETGTTQMANQETKKKNTLLLRRWARLGWASRYQEVRGPEQMRLLWLSLPLSPPSPYSSVLASYHGFNLDVEEPMVFQEDGASFGHSVAQFGGSR